MFVISKGLPVAWHHGIADEGVTFVQRREYNMSSLFCTAPDDWYPSRY